MQLPRPRLKALFFGLLLMASIVCFMNCAPPAEVAVDSRAATTGSDGDTLALSDPSVPTRVIAQQASLVCPAKNFLEIQNCLEQAALKSPDTHMDIVLTATPLVLQENEVIRLSGMVNVSIIGRAGAAGTDPVVIRETSARMVSDTSGNRAYLEIIGKSKAITISNLHLVDLAGSTALLRSKCVTGTHPTNPNLWDPQYCYAPLLVGGVSADTTELVSDVHLRRIKIVSAKAILFEVRRTLGLVVADSIFQGGTVYGVFFHATYKHFNSTFVRNTIMNAGTAGLSIVNAFNTLVSSNKFIDNHTIPQYAYQDANGVKQLYPGGQLYVAVAKDAPIEFVRLLNNEVTMTAAHIGNKMTYGIEVMNGEAAPVTDVLIEGNYLHDISRGGISIHNSATLGQRRITVRKNRLVNVAAGFPATPVTAFVQTEVQPGFANPSHPYVDIDSNSLSLGSQTPVLGSFLSTVKECKVSPTTLTCGITFAWKIDGLPAGSIPVIRLDGKVYRQLGAVSQGTFAVTTIRKRNYSFGLHLNATDPNPVAMINVEGI